MRTLMPAAPAFTRLATRGLTALVLAALLTTGVTPGPLAAQAADADADADADGKLTVAQIAPDDLADLFVRDLAARPATAAEREQLGAELSSGTPPQVLFKSLMDGSSKAGRSANVSGPYAAVVRLYRATFLRAPHHQGVTYWTGKARNGASIDQIATAFARSQEFTNRYGPLSNQQFVDQIYLNILGRPAAARGRAYWQGLLSRGVPRGKMIVNFAEADENVNKTAVSARMSLLTATLLRRAATNREVARWQGWRPDTGDNELIRRVMNSAAYQRRLAETFTYQDPLTGQWSRTVEQRPALAAKIDNVRAARPQYGINGADVVYEEMVEGNLTRLIAVFHSQQPKTIGPVRSIRTTDFDVLTPLDRPLLAASGANGTVLRQLRRLPIVNANALVASNAYWRLSSRSAPNNLMATTSRLWARSRATSTPPPAIFSTGLPASSGKNTGGVNIDFGGTSVTWTWDSPRQQWRRIQDGKPHIDHDGRPVGAENVVVMATRYTASSADAASPHGTTVGRGRALIFTNGTVVDGHWSRAQATDPISYTGTNGEPVTLRPGQTWVELAPIGSFRFRPAD